MEKIAEEHCQQYTPREFISIYEEIMKVPYNFMMIDYRKPLDDRITERFTGSLKSAKVLENAAQTVPDG